MQRSARTCEACCSTSYIAHGLQQRLPAGKLTLVNKRRSQRRGNALSIRAGVQQDLTTINEARDRVSDALQLQGLRPHFGTHAVESVLERAADSLLEAMPQVVRNDLQGAERVGSNVLGAEQNISDRISGAVSGATSSVSNAVNSTVVGAAQSVTHQLTNLFGEPGQVQPHFGTAAAKNFIQQVSSWAPPAAGGSAVSMEFSASAIQDWTTNLLNSAQGITSGETFSTADITGAVQSVLQDASEGVGGYSAQTVALIAVGMVAAIIASVPKKPAFDPEDVIPAVYDITTVTDYFRARPVMVGRRTAAVLQAAGSFGISLFIDNLTGNLDKNTVLRARQLRQTIERLGPAYVKVAQALSTRVDVLNVEYLVQIEMLQDRVPPFPTRAALEAMAQAWGKPVDQVLVEISPDPVAAASLGQVYRGRLRDGGAQVAVKVQRPKVLASIGLDLFVMRNVAAAIQRIPSVNTDWVGLIDEWSGRFFAELDYEAEAASAMQFKREMAKLDGIVVPDVFLDLTTPYVLTTAWVEGEKLSESNAADVRELCTTLLNAYLIQLLETGHLHADPHPGNLIRTPDGKICILDFGLMTDVTSEQRLALVEYIAHLSVQDWTAVTGDLRRLGFIPDNAPDPAIIAEPLGSILAQLSTGGGAKGVNIETITKELEVLTESYPFQVPSYFALILRAFSVIEGIALRVDPQYAIVQECFPYISRRLLVDNDPRIQVALKGVLYGGKQRIDVERLQRLAAGFQQFTVDGLAVEPALSAANGTLTPVVVVDENTKDVLRMVLSPRGSYVQQLLVEELVAAVDALSRDALYSIFSSVLTSIPAMAALNLRRTLGPLGPSLLPLATPLEIMERLVPSVAPTPEDEEALRTIRAIMSLVQTGTPAIPDGTTGRRATEIARELAPLMQELMPGILYTGELFVQKFTARVAARVAQESLGSGAGITASGQRSPTFSTSSFSANQSDGANLGTRGPLAGLLPDLFLPPTAAEMTTFGGQQPPRPPMQ